MALKFFSALFISLVVCLSANAKPTLEDFTKERDLRQIVISPDGHYMARVWNKDGTRGVTINDLQTEGHPVVGQLADRIFRPTSVSWAKNGRLLVNLLVPYNSDAVVRDSKSKKDFKIDDYFMFQRTLAMDVNTENKVELMNHVSGTKWNVNLSAIHHYLPKDPAHILMEAFKDDVNALFKVNVYTGESELLVKGSKNTFMFVSDYEGNTKYRFDYLPLAKKMVIYELKPDNKWELVDSVKLNEVSAEDEINAGDLVGLYGEDLVYRKKNEATGYLELITFKSKEKKFETLVSLPDRDVLFPLTDMRSNRVIGYAVDGDFIRYRFFDAQQQAAYDKLAKLVGDANFYYSSYTEDGQTAIINEHGADNPLSFHFYDAKENKLTLIQSAYLNIATKNLSYSAVANYQTRDGVKIHSYLLLPDDYEKGKKYPLIIMPHGGPQARDRSDYDDFAQFLSTRGYIVMKPNFRGSTGYGKAFEEAGYKQWGQRMQDDLVDAVDYMVKKGYADADKVCIVGISYGGYAALMGAVKNSNVFRCSVSINGVTNLRDVIESDRKSVSDDALIEKYWYQRIGDPGTDKTMLDENSPALHADKIQTPLLIIASTDDSIVHFSQAKTMTSALSKNKKDFVFIKLQDAEHNPFIFKKDMETVYSEVDKFLAKHLQGN